MDKLEEGDWVKCIKKCGSAELPIKVGDFVQIKWVGESSLGLTLNGKHCNGSPTANFRKAKISEIPAQFRPKTTNKLIIL